MIYSTDSRVLRIGPAQVQGKALFNSITWSTALIVRARWSPLIRTLRRGGGGRLHRR